MRRACLASRRPKHARKSPSSPNATWTSPIHLRPRGRDIGDVKEVRVRASGEVDLQSLADRRFGAVAAREKAHLAARDGPARTAEARRHASAFLFEVEKLGRPLDLDSQGGEAPAEQTLVLVLGKHEGVGKWAEPRAAGAEFGAPLVLALCPYVDRREREPVRDDVLRQVELTIELEGACRDGDGARRLPWLGRLVDDPDRDPQAHQPKGEHEPGGTGADDEDLGFRRAGAVGAGCHGLRVLKSRGHGWPGF